VEVATLATQGVKEITLLGQNVNAYYYEQDNEIIDLATLLDYVSEVPGVERIRFTTSHPKEFSAALIDSYRRLPKLVDHVHLPVQSGSDRVLEAMKRGYTRADYVKIINDLKLARSTVSISSDFIVGFPGETASDFDDTMSLVDEVNFDGSFSFMYSPRPGTPAAALPSHVPLPIKKQRLSQLQDKLSENAFRFSQQMIGGEYDVLVEGISKKDPSKLSGRTNNNKVINFEGQERLIGHTVTIKVTEALPNSLRGNVITRD
jgi:tRNA-2-methylthio-N6-dimethylallyladenosine synthase